MAYYFMLETKKSNFKPINIVNSKYFQTQTKKYIKPFAYSLEEIDNFTMMFDNEIELRERLIEEGILPVTAINKPLSIRILNKDKYNKVPYDFLYQKDIEYIMEPERLLAKIIKRFYEGDLLLIKKIANHFSENYSCQTTVAEVRQLIEISIREGKINHHFDDLDENQDKLLTRLLKLIILDSYSDKYGKTRYNNKIKYRNLHHLIALINYYDKETITTLKDEDKNIKEETQAQKTEAHSEKTQPEIEKKSTFVRTRSLGKKKHTLEGQLGFEI